jgi:hypothetical protein
LNLSRFTEQVSAGRLDEKGLDLFFFYKSCNITDLKQKKLKSQENKKNNKKKTKP